MAQSVRSLFGIQRKSFKLLNPNSIPLPRKSVHASLKFKIKHNFKINRDVHEPNIAAGGGVGWLVDGIKAAVADLVGYAKYVLFLLYIYVNDTIIK
jgi:hypothetical protein